MKNLLLIVNPVSGKMKMKTALADVISIFNRNDYRVGVEITNRRGHATEIVKKYTGEYDIIVCCGGDGTLNEVVRGVIQSGVNTPIGYIPAGSTNDFAASIGISSNVSDAAWNIVNGAPISLDVGFFKGAYFTYIASFGAFTATSYNTPQATKNILGHSAYIFEGIKSLSSIKPIFLKVEANGKAYSGEYIFGGIANSTSLGGIVKLKPEVVDMSDGVFEVILVKSPKNLNDFNLILRALATNDYTSDVFEYFNASEITISSEESLPWTLDGEYMDGSGEFTIKNLKQRITIIK